MFELSKYSFNIKLSIKAILLKNLSCFSTLKLETILVFKLLNLVTYQAHSLFILLFSKLVINQSIVLSILITILSNFHRLIIFDPGTHTTNQTLVQIYDVQKLYS
ncbi:MAG: hypothetical protein Q8S84_04670 [bacterium]|nr:hypothetical protein [bacterium]